MSINSEPVQHKRALVRPETDDLVRSVLAKDRGTAEYPHKVVLVDLWHEAAVLLAKKRGIQI